MNPKYKGTSHVANSTGIPRGQLAAIKAQVDAAYRRICGPQAPTKKWSNSFKNRHANRVKPGMRNAT